MTRANGHDGVGDRKANGSLFGFGKHLAQVLGRRRNDGDEVGLTQSPLRQPDLMYPLAPLMQHGEVRGLDAELAELQPRFKNATKIILIRLERRG